MPSLRGTPLPEGLAGSGRHLSIPGGGGRDMWLCGQQRWPRNSQTQLRLLPVLGSQLFQLLVTEQGMGGLSTARLPCLLPSSWKHTLFQPQYCDSPPPAPRPSCTGACVGGTQVCTACRGGRPILLRASDQQHLDSEPRSEPRFPSPNYAALCTHKRTLCREQYQARTAPQILRTELLRFWGHQNPPEKRPSGPQYPLCTQGSARRKGSPRESSGQRGDRNGEGSPPLAPPW